MQKHWTGNLCIHQWRWLLKRWDKSRNQENWMLDFTTFFLVWFINLHYLYDLAKQNRLNVLCIKQRLPFLIADGKGLVSQVCSLRKVWIIFKQTLNIKSRIHLHGNRDIPKNSELWITVMCGTVYFKFHWSLNLKSAKNIFCRTKRWKLSRCKRNDLSVYQRRNKNRWNEM